LDSQSQAAQRLLGWAREGSRDLSLLQPESRVKMKDFAALKLLKKANLLHISRI
jgi:hypothetical protein